MGPVGAVGANFEPGDFGPLAEDAEEPGMSALTQKEPRRHVSCDSL
jgi:hypothetical protein